MTQSALEFCPIHCPNGRLGQDLGFGGFAFSLKLPELLNTNLAAVRAKILFPYWAPNLIPNNAINLRAQLGPVSITKLSPNWACQMGPIHLIKFLLSGEGRWSNADTCGHGGGGYEKGSIFADVLYNELNLALFHYNLHVLPVKRL